MRYMKSLMKIFIPSKYRTLVRFTKANVLDDSSSGTDDESKRNVVKLINDRQQNLKRRARYKIEKAFKEIRDGPMDKVDIKVRRHCYT